MDGKTASRKRISQPWQPWLPWMRLLRIAALPTAISNILAGFLIANSCWQPVWELWLLMISSSCCYLSGMVLNDWCDSAVDALERPHRPIPSGEIAPRSAAAGYLVLTATGILAAGLAGTKSLAIAVALVGAIGMYNVVLKRTFLAPVAMGLCRFLNVLLGASFVGIPHPKLILGWPVLAWWVAAGIGILIIGLTWFARNEAHRGERLRLTLATGVMLAGIAVLMFAAIVGSPESAYSKSVWQRFVLILAIIAMPILWRAGLAIVDRQPSSIQRCVVSVLRSLIFIDAAICFLVAQNQIFYPLATVLLVLPSLLLARWTSAT